MGIRCSDSVANICTDLAMCQASWPGFPRMLGVKVQSSSTPSKRFDRRSSPVAFSMFSLYFLKLVWTGTVDGVFRAVFRRSNSPRAGILTVHLNVFVSKSTTHAPIGSILVKNRLMEIR